MDNEALEEKINKIRLRNEEIRRRHEEVEADKKHAAELNALVKLVPSSDWPERKEPPEFSLPISTSKPKTPLREDSERPSQIQTGSEQKKLHKFAEGDGPPPDPKYNFLADSERESRFDSEQKDPEERSKFQNRSFRGTSRGRGRGGRGREPFQYRDYRGGYTHHNRDVEVGNDAWRVERGKIDEARINRGKNAEGNWRREWDNNKIYEKNDYSKKGDSNRREFHNYDRRHHYENDNRGPHVNRYYNKTSGHQEFRRTQYDHSQDVKMMDQKVYSIKVNSSNIAGTGRVGPRQKNRHSYYSQENTDSYENPKHMRDQYNYKRQEDGLIYKKTTYYNLKGQDDNENSPGHSNSKPMSAPKRHEKYKSNPDRKMKSYSSRRNQINRQSNKNIQQLPENLTKQNEIVDEIEHYETEENEHCIEQLSHNEHGDEYDNEPDYDENYKEDQYDDDDEYEDEKDLDNENPNSSDHCMKTYIDFDDNLINDSPAEDLQNESKITNIYLEVSDNFIQEDNLIPEMTENEIVLKEENVTNIIENSEYDDTNLEMTHDSLTHDALNISNDVCDIDDEEPSNRQEIDMITDELKENDVAELTNHFTTSINENITSKDDQENEEDKKSTEIEKIDTVFVSEEKNEIIQTLQSDTNMEFIQNEKYISNNDDEANRIPETLAPIENDEEYCNDSNDSNKEDLQDNSLTEQIQDENDRDACSAIASNKENAPALLEKEVRETEETLALENDDINISSSKDYSEVIGEIGHDTNSIKENNKIQENQLSAESSEKANNELVSTLIDNSDEDKDKLNKEDLEISVIENTMKLSTIETCLQESDHHELEPIINIANSENTPNDSHRIQNDCALIEEQSKCNESMNGSLVQKESKTKNDRDLLNTEEYSKDHCDNLEIHENTIENTKNSTDADIH